MTQGRYVFLFGVLGTIIVLLVGAFWIQLALTDPHPCGDPVRAVISSERAASSRYGSYSGVHARDESGRVYELGISVSEVEVGDRVNLQPLCSADGEILRVATLIPHSLRRLRDRAGQ
tara:strand:- start:2315 stop:2668 length:354 start_codon:yes stop_codon:yes gene_type:complete